MSEQGMRDPWDNGGGPNAMVRFRLDWLAVQPETLADLLAQIAETPHLTWCLFSERLERFRPALEDVPGVLAGDMVDLWLQHGDAPPNVYVGTTVTTQAEADERIPELLAIPARVRVLRCTPREPLDLWKHMHIAECFNGGCPGEDCSLGWVVCEGGDTPMHPEWVRSLRDQCEEAGVPFWFSGYGKHVSELPAWRRDWGKWRHNYGDQAGRLLDGRTWDGVPT